MKSNLRSQKESFRSYHQTVIDESCKSKSFQMFMGNEASDLDSVVAAVASSLLTMQEKQSQLQLSSSAYVAPALTFALLPLRSENFRRLNTDSVFALKLVDISENEFKELVLLFCFDP